MINNSPEDVKKRLDRFDSSHSVPLAPKNPLSNIRRNYLPLYQLKMPHAYGGIEVDSLFDARHSGIGSHHPDWEKMKLVRDVSLGLNSFLKIGKGPIKEDSPLVEKLAKINQEIIIWLDEWVAPKDSLNANRNKPIFLQAYRKILKKSQKIREYEQRSDFIRNWWENSTFLRFLMAKGSVGSIMLNRQNGVDTTTFTSDLLNQIETENIKSEELLSIIMKLSQGPDLDFAVFPTDVYEQVFEEFQKRGILKKALGNKAIPVDNLVGDEKEKYEVAEINESDITLPPGFRLNSKKLLCSYSVGQIPQKKSIPYRDIIYHTEIVNETTGQVYDYKISALEFMPSTVDESTAYEDTRTGTNATLLSQLRSAGVFLVNTHKRFSPTWLEPSDQQRLNETGVVAKLDSSFAEAMTLPDFPVGNHLNNLIDLKIDSDDSFVATLLGRSLRDGLFNSLNIMTKKDSDFYPFDPFDYRYYKTFIKLAELFRPDTVKQRNAEEMKLGLIQAWLMDFPFLINFLKDTGFSRHVVLGKDPALFQVILDIASKIEKLPYYKNFTQRLIWAKEQASSGKPGKIDGVNLKRMVDQNFNEAIHLIREDSRIPQIIKDGKTDLEILSELISLSFTRVLPRQELWGADLTVNVTDTVNLETLLIKESERIKKPIFGYKIYQNDSNFTFHISRYPRTIKYNIGSQQEYLAVATNVATQMSIEAPKIEPSLDKPRFRIVLGLNRGYSSEKTFSFEEVKDFLGQDFNCKRGKIMSVNYLSEKPVYSELAIIIEGNIDDIQKVFQAADLYGQERFAVELLDRKVAYIIETRHCKKSDLEIQPSQT